jgi:hypothetical protein
MPTGDKYGRYSISKMIQIATKSMQIHKLEKSTKLSYGLIDKISEIYQFEMGALPFEIYNAIQIKKTIFFDTFMSAQRMNSVALTIPYILNLRKISLQNVGMKDEQVSYIF